MQSRPDPTFVFFAGRRVGNGRKLEPIIMITFVPLVLMFLSLICVGLVGYKLTVYIAIRKVVIAAAEGEIDSDNAINMLLKYL